MNLYIHQLSTFNTTYIRKCVKPARVFLNRMLNLLRDNANNDTIFLSKELFKDLNWFSFFLKQFTGVVLYDVRPISADLCLDACLTGFGGCLWLAMLCPTPS